MSCDEIEELLAPYAIEALASDEAARVSEHLSTCRRHDESLASLRATVDVLALAAPERVPPAELRGRILSALDAEPAREGPGVAPARRARAWRFAAPRPAFAWAAAAVLLLAVVGLGVWNAVLQLGGDGGAGPITVRLTGAAGDGEVVYLEDQRFAVFAVELTEPLPGREYQAWGLGADGPVSLGLLPTEGTVAFPADLSDATAVAVTVEPKGGSDQPTTDPVLVANLR